ncbi:MAG: hypothetical protein MPK75_12350 [Alphaproteobacteria bacterium]|nr:hypothetical protein [Alphaproteobacteria bacterium]
MTAKLLRTLTPALTLTAALTLTLAAALTLTLTAAVSLSLSAAAVSLSFLAAVSLSLLTAKLLRTLTLTAAVSLSLLTVKLPRTLTLTAAVSLSLSAAAVSLSLLMTADAARAQTEQTAQKRVIWDVFLWGESRYDTTIIEALAEEVERRSGGVFTFNLLMGTPAIPRSQNLQMIELRVAEAAMICLLDNPSLHPRAMVLHLPFLPVESRAERLALARAVYAHPEVAAEFAEYGARVLLTSARPSLSLMGRGAFPASAPEFAEYPMVIPGHLGESLVTRLGIDRVRLPSLQESGDALLDGRANAVALMPSAHRLLESYRGGEWWATNFNVGNLDCPVLVEEGAYGALSGEHLAILEDAIEAAYGVAAARDAEILEEWGELLEGEGIEEVSYAPFVLEDLRRRVGEDVAAEWIEVMASGDEPVDVSVIYEFVRSGAWR